MFKFTFGVNLHGRQILADNINLKNTQNKYEFVNIL